MALLASFKQVHVPLHGFYACSGNTSTCKWCKENNQFAVTNGKIKTGLLVKRHILFYCYQVWLGKWVEFSASVSITCDQAIPLSFSFFIWEKEKKPTRLQVSVSSALGTAGLQLCTSYYRCQTKQLKIKIIVQKGNKVESWLSTMMTFFLSASHNWPAMRTLLQNKLNSYATGSNVGAKMCIAHATSLFNSFCRQVPKQFASFCRSVYCTLRLTWPSENPRPVPAHCIVFKIHFAQLNWQFEVTHSRGKGASVGEARQYRNQFWGAKTFPHQKQLDL